MIRLRPLRSAALLLSVALFSTSWTLSQGPNTPDQNAPADVEKTAEAETDAAAKEKALKEIEGYGWTREGKAKIGSNAEIQVSDGLRLTDASGSAKLLRAFGNIPSGHELAILASEDFSWWSMFTFSEEGYVKDDEKDDIDADKILEAMQENQKQANVERKAQKLPPYTLTGWAVKPFYNQDTKSLEYGVKLAEEGDAPGSESVNYSTKILGRRGYMNVTLVCAQPELNASLAALRTSLKSFNYVSGETYAEYRKGDKVAEYGLTALVAGGALAVAAKTGLLAKLWKPIAIALVAIGGGIKKLFGKKSA